MKKSSKHANEQRLLYNDFSGGLNSSFTEFDISANELHDSMNMEVDDKTGLLRTCKGTKDITTVSSPIESAAYDVINGSLVIFTTDHHVLASKDFKSFTDYGELTGTKSIVTASWEDGLLIASGGKLQYFKGNGMTTIAGSPDHCNGVFIRSGRVLVFDNTDNILYSAVGDEEDWTIDTSDPSKSLFVQIGYKVGGKLLGMINLSKDILLIKDNGTVFRLENEYPDWKISELGRNIHCRNGQAFCNIGDQVIVLGSGIVQNITTTQDYGDMKPENIGKKVKREILSLAAGTKVRFVPPLNQVWFISGNNYVLVMDCSNGAFFMRLFNAPVRDIVCVDEDIYIFRETSISQFTEDFNDVGKPLSFLANFKTNFSLSEILVKRIYMGIIPYLTEYDDANSFIKVGNIKIPFPKRSTGNTKITVSLDTPAGTKPSELLYSDYSSVYNDTDAVTPNDIVSMRVRCITRNPMVRMRIEGSGFSFTLNHIGYDWTEV